MSAEGVIAGKARIPPVLGAAVVPLLALMVFIQYVDRGNIATAAPLMKMELRLSAAQIGLLVSAFYWTYVPGQLLSGWLAHRLNAYRTLGLGLAIWSLATFATGLVGGFVALIALRLVLGLGESAAFPCSSRLLAQHLPSSKLGYANGLTGVGLALGPAIGTWAGGNLMAIAGWRPTFLIFGFVSLLWLAPWQRATRHLDRADRVDSGPPAPDFLQIVKRREVWGASLGHFCANYGFYLVVSWLPLYLVQAHGFSMSQMAQAAGLIYGVYAASCIVAGWLCDRWIRAGASTNLVRKGAIIAGHSILGLSLIAAGFGDATLSIVCLIGAAAGQGMIYPSLMSNAQTLAGPRAAGKWMGVQNCIGNIAGIVGPIATGIIVDKTGSFFWAFVSAGAVCLLGVICWGFIVRKVAPLEWS